MTKSDETEVWLPVVGREGRYEVSNIGRIRRSCGGRGTRAGHVHRLCPDPSGYLRACLPPKANGPKTFFFVHRLVADAFLPADDARPFVNHKNGVHDDNRVENLEWCTNAENIAHGYRVLGRSPVSGEACHFSKLQANEVRSIREALRKGQSRFDLAEKFAVHPETIRVINKRWKGIR